MKCLGYSHSLTCKIKIRAEMKKAFSSCGLAYGLIFKVQVKSDDCDPCKIVKSELSVPN